MDENALKLFLLLSSVVLAILGWIRFYVERRSKTQAESKYKVLYTSILAKKIEQVKSIDHHFIEDKIAEIINVTDRLSQYDIPHDELIRIRKILDDLIDLRYSRLLFSSDPLFVLRAIGYFEDRRESIDLDLLKILYHELESKSGKDWATAKDKLKGIITSYEAH
jgi:hypothetical protein